MKDPYDFYEEEKRPSIDPDMEDKLNYLGICPNGFSVRKPLKWNENPQQVWKTFDDWGITISSRFDSGNLGKVVKVGDNAFDLWLSGDGEPYVEEELYKTWFYFSITGVRPSTTVTFTIRNMKNQTKLYTAGMRPVFKTTTSDGNKTLISWRKIPAKPSFTWNEEEEIFTLKWTYACSKSEEDVTYFAYSYPWSFKEITQKLDEMQAKMINRRNVYFHRETLTYSREGRKQEMVTVSSWEGLNENYEREEDIPGLFPEAKTKAELRPLKYYDKKIVFVTSRVHPGETGASHMFNGFLDLLMDQDNPQSRGLLKNFVFKIIPAMNPDGVYRGYYRSDTCGQNLNRHYLEPCPDLQPTTFSVKNVIKQWAEYGTLHMYVDFHAHASKKGIFLFGNSLEGEEQVENVLFARLMSLNCINFDMTEWSFSDKIMTKKDKKGESREGTGRVAIYKDTNCRHWYTLECNYYTGKRLSMIPPKFNRILGKGVPETELTDSTSSFYKNGLWPAYTIGILEDVGRCFGAALLDLVSDNPISRLPLSRFKNLDGVRSEVSQTLTKSKPAAKVLKSAYSKNKPPLKVNVKKGSLKIKSTPSNNNIKPGLKKATSMQVKTKKALPKSNSDVTKIMSKAGKKHNSLAMIKVNSSQSQNSTATSSTKRTRMGGSADVRKAHLEKRKPTQHGSIKSVSRV